MSRTILVNFPGILSSIPAHKHENGGGWVANTAYAHRTAFVHKTAMVWGYAVVNEDAHIGENAQIYGSTVVEKDASVVGYRISSGTVRSPKTVDADVSLFVDFETTMFMEFRIEITQKRTYYQWVIYSGDTEISSGVAITIEVARKCAKDEIRRASNKEYASFYGRKDYTVIEQVRYDFGNGFIPAHKHENGGGWVADTAIVAKTAYVSPYAQVIDSARVREKAWIRGNAKITENSEVACGVVVGEDIVLYGNVVIKDTKWRNNVTFFMGPVEACVKHQVVWVREIARLIDFGNGGVPAHKHPNGGGWVADTAKVHPTAYICPESQVSGNAVVGENVKVLGRKIEGNTIIHSPKIIIFFVGKYIIKITKRSKFYRWVLCFAENDIATGMSATFEDAEKNARAANTEIVDSEQFDTEDPTTINSTLDFSGDTVIMRFDFGNGLVPAHKHENGGGWVADTAKVAKKAYVGPTARVWGTAYVSEGCTLYDTSGVFGSSYLEENVTLSGTVSIAGDVVIPKGAIIHALVTYTLQNQLSLHDFGNGLVPAHRHENGGGWVADTAVVSSEAHIGANSVVYDNAQVLGASQVLDSRVYGDVVLDNTTISNKYFCGKIKIENYDFGSGLVAAYKCPNGGGWVATTVNLKETAFIGPFAKAFGHTDVAGKLVDSAQVSGFAKIGLDVTLKGNIHVCGCSSILGDVTLGGAGVIDNVTKIFGNGG